MFTPTPEYLNTLTLRQGIGSGRPGDRCAIQELRAWLELDPTTDDIPPCVSMVIGSLVIAVQDERPEWREQIIPLLPRLIGSAASRETELQRVFACADWAVRVAAPAALDAAGLSDHAERLRSLAQVIDEPTAYKAASAARAVAYAAYAADYAARAPDAAAYAASVAVAADDAATAADDAVTADDADEAVVPAVRSAEAADYVVMTADYASINPVALIEALLGINDVEGVANV
jgi:hypothetical protein